LFLFLSFLLHYLTSYGLFGQEKPWTLASTFDFSLVRDRMIDITTKSSDIAHVSARPANQDAHASEVAAQQVSSHNAGLPAFLTPIIKVDAATNTAVLQIRDSNDGEVVAQYPSEQQLKAYREAGSQQDQRQRVATAEVAEKATSAVNQSVAVKPAQTGGESSLSGGNTGGSGGRAAPAPAPAPAVAPTAAAAPPAPKAPSSGSGKVGGSSGVVA
jgi:hypothetical protein